MPWRDLFFPPQMERISFNERVKGPTFLKSISTKTTSQPTTLARSSSNSQCLTWIWDSTPSTARVHWSLAQSSTLTEWPCITWAERCSVNASNYSNRLRVYWILMYSRRWWAMLTLQRGREWSHLPWIISGVTTKSKDLLVNLKVNHRVAKPNVALSYMLRALAIESKDGSSGTRCS